MRLNNLFVMLCFFLLSGCSGCSKSGKRQVSGENAHAGDHRINPSAVRGDKTIVKMEMVNGVYQIPVEIDGVKMSFIFDTGASTISISETEAVFLHKQGLLSDDDIEGSAKYTDANGNISEGTVIKLKTVKVGDRVLTDVEASVVHNLNAPLLIGQSALAKFGKISIDYNEMTITFE